MDYESNDLCNALGAGRLKQRIEEFWRARGCAVKVQLLESRFTAAMRSSRTDVRSDMLDGLPSRKVNPTDCASAAAA